VKCVWEELHTDIFVKILTVYRVDPCYDTEIIHIPDICRDILRSHKRVHIEDM
jgi:hypothetical protein